MVKMGLVRRFPIHRYIINDDSLRLIAKDMEDAPTKDVATMIEMGSGCPEIMHQRHENLVDTLLKGLLR